MGNAIVLNPFCLGAYKAETSGIKLWFSFIIIDNSIYSQTCLMWPSKGTVNNNKVYVAVKF
jgi:hypothetical protein